MEILNTPIGRGKSKVINLNIAKLHTRTSLAVPIIVERGKEDGPCVLLTAGIHGDEVNGVEIVRQIVANDYNKPQKGTVICIPVINVFGFLNQEREFPDGRDLNRLFPGSKRGSLAGRFAYHIMNAIVPHIDYCMDFHTGGAARFNYSQVRLDIRDREVLTLAKAFGAKFIVDAENRDKSFRSTLSKKGKKVLLFEGGKTLHLDRHVTQVGIDGALRVMHHLGMRDFTKELMGSRHPEKVQPILVKKSTWIRAKHSGMFRTELKLGSQVSKGDKIGSISDPYGDFEVDVISTYDGYIIAANHAPIVNQGDALVHVSKETSLEF
ncbi:MULTISPECIES: succinylglutamate desuccinylase/aspartoacylase family protein [unclassified Aureispira]|uniref:succinylglutamate desuccinylase/aspartoacylase family protein n=1 Tax=unclassified Aureispira TaxID=2649989 RepID=UPI00069608EE|nr:MULTISPECIES: succinylglutamate desuccinylase/aspartoacylase family protein [unclassified Aureispira]WMX12812.1 succinylglutamate desuccinylase/aspartoacylase family protein [Aureispira sp. CCB-E]